MTDRMWRAASAAVLSSVFLAPSLALARTPNDLGYDKMWYAERIGAPAAWDVATGRASVVVAVLDAGIAIDHPDLSANIWINSREIVSNGIDDDGNGFIDDVHGWDFVDNDNAPLPPVGAAPEVDMHGTAVSGIIAAVGNNTSGYAGILWEARVMPLRILGDNGSGRDDVVAKGIRYAVANGADVINLSFAGNGMSEDLESALRDAYRAGVVVVAAMGNDGRNADDQPVYPACARSTAEDWVIGVTAVNKEDTWTDFTNYGKSCADIAAPGTSIFGLGGVQEQYYGPWYGTSAATPIVSGSAALLRAAYPGLTVDDVRSALKLSVDPLLGTAEDRRAYGVGRLNIGAAMRVAAQLPSATAPARVKPAGTVTPPPATDDADSGAGSVKESNYSFVATGAPRGTAPVVRVFSADGKEVAHFAAYDERFKGGVAVALGDFLSAHEGPEIVTAPGEGGGPHVRVFTSSGALIAQFFPYSAKSSRGVSVAVGDLTGNGQEGIVTAVGSGVSDEVKMFDVTGREAGSFTVKGLPKGERWGVTLADIDDDVEQEIVVFTLSGKPEARVFNLDGKEIVSFAGPNGTGMSVAAVDGDGDAREEFVVAVRAGDTAVRAMRQDGAVIRRIFSFDHDGGQIVTADIDVDGRKDIVALSSKGTEIVMYHTDGKKIGTLVTGIAPGSSLAAW